MGRTGVPVCSYELYFIMMQSARRTFSVLAGDKYRIQYLNRPARASEAGAIIGQVRQVNHMTSHAPTRRERGRMKEICPRTALRDKLSLAMFARVFPRLHHPHSSKIEIARFLSIYAHFVLVTPLFSCPKAMDKRRISNG